MRKYLFGLLVGLTTTVTVCAPLPTQAAAKIYQNVSGSENLILDPEGLAVLESIGLSFDSVENTTQPVEGYDYAFAVVPPSEDPNVRGTASFFSYDSQTGEYTFLGGNDELIGSLFFDVDTDKLALGSELELGDFSISFVSEEQVLITDTVTTGLPVLQVIPPEYDPIVDLASQTWIHDGIEVLVSQAFSDFLVAAGASTPITGLKIADARLDRGFVEVSVTPVPEPNFAPIIWIGVGATLAVRKKWRRAA